MTIGQRIAYKRKELALSQEALGETLGVSRQSIYKWESDTALPEIDKLISLSRLFGVSVGWLLGTGAFHRRVHRRTVRGTAEDGKGDCRAVSGGPAETEAPPQVAVGPAGIRLSDWRIQHHQPAGSD